MNLFKEEHVAEHIYNKKRAKYIAEYKTYYPGGFLSVGSLRHDTKTGEAKWNKLYPNGYSSWRNEQRSLNSAGEQILIDKVNELVVTVNELKKELN